MPKGEHKKVNNPRIYLLGFKVNKGELEALKKLAKDSNMTISEYMRIKSLEHADNKG